jgi:group I intron endonuclease
MDLIKNFSSGIYCIKCMVDGKEYIGQAKNLYKRNSGELSSLNNNRFHNIHLQRAWNKYGSDNFCLSILFDNLSASQLDDYEIMAILLRDLPDPNKGYNMSVGGGNKIVTDVTRKKISDTQLNKTGGIRLSEDELMDLYINKGLSLGCIADMCNVDLSSVSNWLKEYDIPIRNNSESHLIKSGGIKPSKEELFDLYINNYYTPDMIGDMFNISGTVIRKLLNEYNIPTRTLSESQLMRNGGIKPSYDELFDLYVNKGYSAIDIGIMCNVSQGTICRWLVEYDIEIRSTSESHLIKSGGIKPSYDELFDLYVNKGYSPNMIAVKYNISPGPIRRLLKEYNMPSRSLSDSHLAKRGAVKPSKEELFDLYINNYYTPDMIGDMFNVSSVTIRNWLKEYDIPIRSNSESANIYYQNKRSGDSD